MAGEEQLNPEEQDVREEVEHTEATETEVAGEIPPEIEVEALRAALETAEEEAVAAKDQALRALAEAQNMKRRAEIDADNARKYGQEKLIGELLPVVDNLERAIEAADADNELVKPILEGIELTHKSFLGALEKSSVAVIDPQGEPFDPQSHQAMSMVENPDVEPNTVIAVMQKGYSLHGRLIRPAMVMVSKPAPKVDESA